MRGSDCCSSRWPRRPSPAGALSLFAVRERSIDGGSALFHWLISLQSYCNIDAMAYIAESAPAGGEMILHEFTRNCSGVCVHFDVVVMPGMVWLYIGDGELRFDALSFAAGNQGQKIPSSSCLMQGPEEDRGVLSHNSCEFPGFLSKN